MYKSAWGIVVRECGVDPLTIMNVSKSPEHIYYPQSTLTSVVGTPLTVRILFLPQKKFLAVHRRVRKILFRGKACILKQCSPSSLNFNYRPADEEHVFTFNLSIPSTCQTPIIPHAHNIGLCNVLEIQGVTSAGGGSVITEDFNYKVRCPVHLGIQ